MNVLTLNVGSSSLKFGIHRVQQRQAMAVAEGEIDTRDGQKRLLLQDESGQSTEHAWNGELDDDSLRKLQQLAGDEPFGAVAHRIVHGGPALREHSLIDAEVLARIEAAASFAPLHVPAALRWIRHAQKALPNAKQVACLDTAFHHPLPDLSRVLPLPRELQAKGIERYGFHGLSCESIVAQLDVMPERLIIAHLGSGASLTAVRRGKSVDTSMGMTPTGGIIMGTRPGDLDPGVMLFLMREGHAGPRELEDLLEHRSGLRGISGVSADMRALREAAGNASAELALEQFTLSVAREAAAMAVVLGGIDLLVFTGGIGEHDGATRERVAAWLAPCFGNLRTRVLPAQENHVMALHAARLAAA
ncbi:acetate kinase [Dyella sp. C11]|uniref:acetate/propionate family kinase n=1 Tax=Dyella sp. C11 TaxID=2126991 RepID=UPI000D650FB2|nr:acetate kinase [Dyella sp. C11]